MNRGIKNLLISTRANRALPSVALILFTAAFRNKINLEIFLLSIIVVILYIPGGILNAIKDKDHLLPKYSKKLVIILPIIALLISTYSFKLFLAASLWILVGFIYNIFSRKIILLDTTIIGLTHHFLPIFFGLLILNTAPYLSFLIAFQFYITFWFISPIKNLNGIETDKKLKYKTLPESFTNGEKITKNLVFFSAVPILLSTLIYQLNYISIFFLTILLSLYLFSNKIINIKDKTASLEMARLIFSLFALALSFSFTNNIIILSTNSTISLFFFFSLIRAVKN